MKKQIATLFLSSIFLTANPQDAEAGRYDDAVKLGAQALKGYSRSNPSSSDQGQPPLPQPEASKEDSQSEQDCSTVEGLSAYMDCLENN